MPSTRPASRADRPSVTTRGTGHRDTRQHNLAIVLRSLFTESGLSRADLAGRTGLTKVTVSALISELMGDGLVAESGVRVASGPGKPATMLTVRPDGRHLVCLQLSERGTMHAAVLDLHGRTLHQESRPLTLGGSGARTQAEIAALAAELTTWSPVPVLGIGIATPGTVGDDGVVRASTMLGWSQVPLADLVGNRTGLPVTVVNDANAAAVAEHRYGGASPDLLLVQLAGGVGAGVLVDGRVHPGSSRTAGEFGHVVVGPAGGDRCPCGKVGCLETRLSVPAIRRHLDAVAHERSTVLRAAGELLGEALAPVVAMVDVAEVVLSGPADLVTGPLAETTAAAIEARIGADFRDAVPVRASALDDRAGLLGAGALVLREHLGVF